MINYLGNDVLYINDNECIIIESNEKNNIFWKEAYYVCNNEKRFISSYFTHRDVIDYNDNYIAILALEYDDNNNPKFRVKKIFDIKNKEFIMGNSEELTDYYQNNFLSERSIRSI